MKVCRRTTLSRALTLIEVLLLVILLFVLFSMIPVSFSTNTKARAYRIRCTNNLKQVGVAFRIWSADCGDGYAMQTSTNRGGSLEFIGSAQDTFRHFDVMSNELSTPKILFCPAETDSSRMATLFRSARRSSSFDVLFTSNSNLSYFVGVDARDTSPHMLLCGDWNLTNGMSPVNGLLTLMTNQPIGWTTAMHKREGNILFADGSVQGLSSSALQSAVANTDSTTNRLAMP